MPVLALCLLAAAVLAGCGQTPTAEGATGAAPTAVSAPTAPPVPTAEPTVEPTAAMPAIAPERLEAGRKLLAGKGCITCHTVAGFDEARGSIGPDLSHAYGEAVAALASPAYAASKGKAATPRDFLRESILEPSAYVAESCPGGPCPDHVMPRSFAARLTPDELETLLDLLTSLE